MAEPVLRLATFTADVTPPVGSPMDCGFDPPVSSVEHPLLAKGVILRQGTGAWAVCAIDSCGLCNTARDRVAASIAEAAGTTPDRVAVQAVHQHTAPAIDLEAQCFLDDVPGAPVTADPGYLEFIVAAVAEAVHTAQWHEASHIACGWAPVDRVASNRRTLLPDGTIDSRSSLTHTPRQRHAPEGLIDGFARCVSFLAGETPVAQLHYYATHPQSWYRDGRVTWDVPGMARQRLQEESGVFQVYFTGCAGEIAMSKYNDGDAASRALLAERLYAGMQQAAASFQRVEPVDGVRWQTCTLPLEPRVESAFSEATCRQVMADDGAAVPERVKAAMILAFRQQLAQGRAYGLSALSIGSVSLLHLPGEPFVAYQLYAQQRSRQRFVAVAGYGDCAMWYMPTDATFAERGGYETTWAFAMPCEAGVQGAIDVLLEGAGRQLLQQTQDAFDVGVYATGDAGRRL